MSICVCVSVCVCACLTLQLLDQLGELVVEQHVILGGEGRLWTLGSTGVQLMFGDEAQLLHKVLLPNTLLYQLFQLLPGGGREERDGERGGERGERGGGGEATEWNDMFSVSRVVFHLMLLLLTETQRDRKRERDRERPTERDQQGETNRERETERDKQRERESGRERERNKKTNKGREGDKHQTASLRER